MSNLIKVVNVWYDEDPKYKSIHSGLLIELEDGRMLAHAQDGFVEPFEQVKGE